MSNIFKNSKKSIKNEKTNVNKKNEEKNEEKINFFMKKKEKKEEYTFEEGSFPTLGGGTIHVTTPISFSAALNKEQKEKKKEKNKWAGWLVIKKDGTRFQHEDSGRYMRVKAFLDELNANNKYIRYEKRWQEEEDKKRMERIMNGPECIQSWEVDSYLKSMEKEERNNEEDSDVSDYEDHSE